MSVLQYENFQESNYFSAINLICMRLRDDGDVRPLRELVAEVSDDLRQEAALFLFDYSITAQSEAMFKLAKDMGVLEVPGFMQDLEIAMTLRDRMFQSAKEPSVGHMELLREYAEVFGEAFAFDSMSAVYNIEFARNRSGARQWPTGTEQLATYSANLQLLIRFTPPELLNNPALGNIGIRHIRDQQSNLRSDDPIADHLKHLSALSFDDLVATANVITYDPMGRGQYVHRQIDAGVRKGLKELGRDFVLNLELALKLRPIDTLMTLATMNEVDFQRFVSCDGMLHYLTTQWITEENAQILKDPAFLDVHELFNNRLLSSPYLPGVFQRNETLRKPNIASVSLTMMLAQLKDKGVHVSIGSKNGMKTFGECLELLRHNPAHAEVVQAGRVEIASAIRRRPQLVYDKLVRDKKHGLKPADEIDKEDLFKMVVVRLCAELHQESKAYTQTELSNIKPIGSALDIETVGLNHKEALLALVRGYDELFVLDALRGYKPGLKPMIELGVLGRKHMALLPAKLRGDMLESAMGL
jgi:hypothetical protein